MSAGINIKKRRLELGLSQQELADAMGYKTRSTITKIEADINSVSYKKLERFAKVLDTSIETLTRGGSDKPIDSIQSQSVSKNVVVILAGGKSTRNQQNIPNQFINVLGRPLITYSMKSYQNHPSISEIYVVCLDGWEDILISYAKEYGITKFAGVISGGKTGILSIKNAVEFLQTKLSANDIVIFQESTRPLVTQEMISKTINSVKMIGSSVMSEPMDDYIQFSQTSDGVKYIDRNTLVSIQSPEGYMLQTLTKAFAQADSIMDETCCAMFMYNNNYPLNFITGSHHNLKIVRQEDIGIVTSLLKEV